MYKFIKVTHLKNKATMKTATKIFGLLALVALLAFSSCRKDNDDYEPPPEDVTITNVERTVYNLS